MVQWNERSCIEKLTGDDSGSAKVAGRPLSERDFDGLQTIVRNQVLGLHRVTCTYRIVSSHVSDRDSVSGLHGAEGRGEGELALSGSRASQGEGADEKALGEKHRDGRVSECWTVLVTTGLG